MDSNIEAYWLGHSAFKLTSPNGEDILIDPFLSQNSYTPEEWQKPEEVDYILLTHGHEDHVGDTIDIAQRTGCTVACIVELGELLKNEGLDEDQLVQFNKGGTVQFDDFNVTLTSANHSSSFGGEYAGDPGGLVLHFEDDITIYHLGDTNIFADLQLYGQLYDPDIAFVPMGDHFTMGPEEAAHATNMLEVDYAVPIHYGTFPVLTGKPEDFKSAVTNLTDTEVLIPEAGENFIK